MKRPAVGGPGGRPDGGPGGRPDGGPADADRTIADPEEVDLTQGSPAWRRAALAVALFQIDPAGLGGLWLRARAGPQRDRLIEAVAGPAASGDPDFPLRRLHPTIGDDALFGGLDLTETLAAGALVQRPGLLATPARLVLTMAERAGAGLAARLAGALDRDGHGLLALDEGAEPDEALAPALADRLALHVDLDGVPWGETAPAPPFDPLAARARLGAIGTPDEALADLTRVAARLGVASLRAPTLALRAARAAAALAGRDEVTTADLQLAVELVLAPRATMIPETQDAAETPEEDQPRDDPPPPDDQPEDGAEEDANQPLPEDAPLPEEVMLAAATALLPPDLLARIAAGRAARTAPPSSGAGARRKGAARGRPLPSRPGRLDGAERIDLIATLRAAAPWQGLRAKAPGRRLAFRPADIRVKRYEERTERLIIFAVDASGSAAFARLGEAKGAVELLLAEAYARRDQVALISFRGAGAELLLPATRSLVQTKRRLAGLPGGGGTPLAAGLEAALRLALAERAKGRTPAIALLTDGRANIALDGEADRPRAAADAAALAGAIRAKGVAAIVIDMGARPERALAGLAAAMDAPYVPMPRADAARLSAAVGAGLG